MSRPTSVVHRLLEELLAAVVDEYDDAGVELPERRYVSGGTPSWDCESVTTWLQRTNGHDGDVNREAPTSLTGYEGFTLRAMTAGITVCRCTPDQIDMTDEYTGRPKFATAEVLTAASAQLHADEVVMVNALRSGSAAGRLPNLNDMAVLDFKIVGPMSGFVAAELMVRMGTDWTPPDAP